MSLSVLGCRPRSRRCVGELDAAALATLGEFLEGRPVDRGRALAWRVPLSQVAGLHVRGDRAGRAAEDRSGVSDRYPPGLLLHEGLDRVGGHPHSAPVPLSWQLAGAEQQRHMGSRAAEQLAGVLFEGDVRSALWAAAICSLVAQTVDALHRRSQLATRIYGVAPDSSPASGAQVVDHRPAGHNPGFSGT